MTIHIPSEIYPFFQQSGINNKHHITRQIIYHQMMTIIINQIFLHHTQKNIEHKILDKVKYLKIKKHHPQNLANIQSYQPMNIQNQPNTQSYQPIQSQNPAIMHSYQPTQMQIEIQLPYYLQQHEITQNQFTNFSKMPNAAESLQMTMNLYLMGGSSRTSNKPLMVFTGTDPEYSVEDYLNAVRANLILNVGSEPINTPLHQNWIQRRTALNNT